MIDLSIVLPAYREAENLAILLPRLIKTASSLGVRYEILIVDTDPSLDATPALCAKFAEAGVIYLPRGQGPTFGSAVRTGIVASRGEHVVFLDADGSHEPEFIAKLFNERSAADVVIASRYIKGGMTDNPWALRQMSQFVNLAFRITFGLKCRDMSNSFRLYRGDMLRALDLSCQNFDIVEEILIKMKRRNPGFRLKEIPCYFRERVHGKTKRQLVVFAIGFLVTLARLRFMR